MTRGLLPRVEHISSQSLRALSALLDMHRHEVHVRAVPCPCAHTAQALRRGVHGLRSAADSRNHPRKAAHTRWRRAAPSQVVQDVVTYGVELTVDNSELTLRPGVTASVHIRTRTGKKALRVPVSALTFTPPRERRGNASEVWQLQADQLKRVSVQAGISNDDDVQVTTHALGPVARVRVELTPAGRLAYGIAH